jgi:hypothetical protein
MRRHGVWVPAFAGTTKKGDRTIVQGDDIQYLLEQALPRSMR